MCTCYVSYVHTIAAPRTRSFARPRAPSPGGKIAIVGHHIYGRISNSRKNSNRKAIEYRIGTTST